MDREKLAWAAGFFDGEGCFSYKLRHRSDGALDRSIQVRITQADGDVLYGFAEAVGLGRVYGPYPRPKANWSQMWQYAAYGFEQAQAIIAMLWPWLGAVKRKQAKDMLSEIAKNPPRKPGRPPKRRVLAPGAAAHRR